MSNDIALNLGSLAPSPMQPLMERFRELGVPALFFDEHHEVIACDAEHRDLHTLLNAPELIEQVRREAGQKLSDPRRVHDSAVVELIRGVWTGVIPNRGASGVEGYAVAFFFDSEAWRHPLLATIGKTVHLDPGAVAAAVRPFACFTKTTAQLMVRSLCATADDLTQLTEREVAQANFTFQLSGAFDTIDLLYSVGRAMGRPFSPREFLRALCEKARSTLHFQWMVVHFGASPGTPLALRGTLVDSGSCPLAEQEMALAVAPFMADPDRAARVRTNVAHLTDERYSQIITQPLEGKAGRIGVLVAGGKFGDDPVISSYDSQLLEASSGFINTFIENVNLYEEQHELFMGTVQALTASIDAKDRYTCGHSERVALLSWLLAKAAGLSDAEADNIRIAGLVHDVGKIGVPEAILTKAGRLTEDEFGHIKRHPEIGHKILQSVPRLESVLPGVLHHHERYDGRGYPHGLAGERIPLMARIISVADTFDAMSSDRSYRRRIARELVLEEIARSGGTQLDPVLAEKFLKIDLTEYDAMTRKHATEHQAPASKAA